jgi:uncharacterized RDD family membrane protein YckC
MDQSTNPGARFAPPSARIDDPSPAPGELVLADRGTRFVAALIDAAIGFGLLWLVSKVTPWNPFSTEGAGKFLTTLINSAIGLVLFIVVHGWLLVQHGQTIGKRLLRLRIVRPDGARVDPVRILGLRYGIGSIVTAVRYVGMLYALVDCLMIFRQQRRCVHDLLADTIVVRV